VVFVCDKHTKERSGVFTWDKDPLPQNRKTEVTFIRIVGLIARLNSLYEYLLWSFHVDLTCNNS
jgi:hypothetical protein